LQKKVFPMVECRLGNGRPLIEKGRLRLVSVPSSPPKPYFEWQARRFHRARVDRVADAAFASLQQLGVEILPGLHPDGAPATDGLTPASDDIGPASIGPLRRLLARSRR
jgi:hypothetical protein